MSSLLNLMRQRNGQSFISGEVGLMLCGDSITNANISKDSTSALKENSGIITTLNTRMVQRFKLIDAFDLGVGGETAQTRVSNLTEYTTVAGRHPEIRAAVEAYGRNDISAGRSASQVATDRQTIITHLLTLVDKVFVESIKPSDYGGSTVAKNQVAEAANALMETFCAGDSRLHYINTYDALGDDTGYAAGNSDDAIHLSAQGAWRAASVYLPILTSIYSSGAAFSVDLNDLATNPGLSGTSGTPGTGTTGDIADGWSGVYSGGTTDISRTFSKTAGGFQRIVVSAGTGAGTDEVTYFQQQITTGFNTGEVYRAHIAVKVNSATRGYWIGLQVRQRNSGGTTIYTSTDMDKKTSADFIDGAAMAGQTIYLQPADFIVEEDCTQIELRFVMGVNANGSVASMDVEVEKMAVQQVTLNVLEELGDVLEFWMDPDDSATFTYNPTTFKISQINDKSYNGNDAVNFGSYTNQAIYSPSTAAVNDLPTLANAGVSAEQEDLGYRFSHSLSLATDRTLIAVARADLSVVESGGSSSNALFTVGSSGSSASTGAIRNLRDNKGQHQMTGRGYGSSYGESTDTLKSYWFRCDGTNVDGGYDLSITEGPTAVDDTGLTQSGYGYVFTDASSSTVSYVGWARDLMLFSSALSNTQLQAVLRYLRDKSGI